MSVLGITSVAAGENNVFDEVASVSDASIVYKLDCGISSAGVEAVIMKKLVCGMSSVEIEAGGIIDCGCVGIWDIDVWVGSIGRNISAFDKKGAVFDATESLVVAKKALFLKN